MTIDAELLPIAQVEEMVRAVVKASRAFQMYLPNNPMYQRADEALRAALEPVFVEVAEVALLIDEARMIWEEAVVYDHEPKADSFAWGLYKDGLRLLVLKKGVAEEIGDFLRVVAKARLLPADTNEDLLTLLWQHDFTSIDYRFAEVVSDPWVYDPQALTLEAQLPSETERLQQVQAEAAATPRPEGVVKLDEFDSTLYFLEESEIAALSREVEREYERDVHMAALLGLFDVFELVAEVETRKEIRSVLEIVLPHLLSGSEFAAVATVLREFRAIRERLATKDPGASEEIKKLESLLSQPEPIAQLLEALDAADELPSQEDLAEVLRELEGPALGAILEYLPRLEKAEVKQTITEAARRLARANGELLIRLLTTLPQEALPGAITLVGQLGTQGAVSAVGGFVTHRRDAIRLAAVEALGALGTPGALAALEPAVDDEERTVRSAAVAIVANRSYVGALRRLELAVRGRGPVELERAERRQVYEAYAEVAGANGLGVFKAVLRGQGLFRRKLSVDTRTCVAYALGRIHTPEAREVLESLARDKEVQVRHAATSVLREWPDD